MLCSDQAAGPEAAVAARAWAQDSLSLQHEPKTHWMPALPRICSSVSASSLASPAAAAAAATDPDASNVDIPAKNGLVAQDAVYTTAHSYDNTMASKASSHPGPGTYVGWRDRHR